MACQFTNILYSKYCYYIKETSKFLQNVLKQEIFSWNLTNALYCIFVNRCLVLRLILLFVMYLKGDHRSLFNNKVVHFYWSRKNSVWNYLLTFTKILFFMVLFRYMRKSRKLRRFVKRKYFFDVSSQASNRALKSKGIPIHVKLNLCK